MAEDIKREELGKLQTDLGDLRVKLEKLTGDQKSSNLKIDGIKDDIKRVEKQIDKVSDSLDEFKEVSADDAKAIRDNVKRDIGKLYELIKKEFTNKAEFDPVKLIVYGLTGIILSVVAYTLASLLIHLPTDHLKK